MKVSLVPPYRRSIRGDNSRKAMNPWEDPALSHVFIRGTSASVGSMGSLRGRWNCFALNELWICLQVPAPNWCRLDTQGNCVCVAGPVIPALALQGSWARQSTWTLSPARGEADGGSSSGCLTPINRVRTPFCPILSLVW